MFCTKNAKVLDDLDAGDNTSTNGRLKVLKQRNGDATGKLNLEDMPFV